MQLGRRWRAGETPHPSVPDALHEDIRAQETRFPAAHSWTLTWLEGRPRIELDDLVLIEITAGGAVRAVDPHTDDDLEEDDEWLS